MKILEILFSKNRGVTRLHPFKNLFEDNQHEQPTTSNFSEKDDKPSHQTAVVIEYIREMSDFWKFLQTSWNLD